MTIGTRNPEYMSSEAYQLLCDIERTECIIRTLKERLARANTLHKRSNLVRRINEAQARRVAFALRRAML